jgi:50S ribosomal subunit-associated GTPase HflX
VLQQIESVEKILLELKLNEIPQMIVLNKADLVDEDSLEALKRQISLDKGPEIVAVSAIRPATLKPLVVKTGEVIGKFIGTEMDARGEQLVGDMGRPG